MEPTSNGSQDAVRQQIKDGDHSAVFAAQQSGFGRIQADAVVSAGEGTLPNQFPVHICHQEQLLV